MFDCSKDVRAYHDQDVTLPKSEQDAMRDRRDSNRTRLRKGLEKAGKPKPIEFVKQGSYAMKTMCRDVDNDYDIDDGVYFEKDDLVSDRGAEMTSLQARQMVRDAVDDGKFKRAPEVRSSCVRVFYEKGYHVDLPVYRRVVTDTVFGEEVHYELAASSGWKRSDARDVSEWYEDERAACADGIQLRRINRDLKKYARSRYSWRGAILSGFGISVLTTERFRVNDREDRALYDTMVAIRDRLNWDLVVTHPVTPGDTITSGSDDAKARRFREKLTEAIDTLAPLFAADCTREKALKCWDKVFATTFFSERLEEEQRAHVAAPAIIGSAALLGATAAAASAVSSAGGGRHA
ncbi:cyclic GMP-AMP synthase DncV-like nucleotidyltransferase [Chenggangzhangella methanolivorans]|uniref:cyclic GMP-AMP synthase DncV-like nucleotidyltransferase n=1 Tax=Chenggangzhangella methanolivorans TaxID=1437009 RepID=UPI00361833A5